MVLKLIDATQAKSGTMILIDNEPFSVRSNDKSKSGKHGSAKCRIEAIGVFNGKKKVLAVPGHERFEVPNVEKKRAQVLSVADTTASVMDMESYETIDVEYQEDIKDQLVPDRQCEVWDIEGKKKIMRGL
jgi:translation initiation factor 5A